MGSHFYVPGATLACCSLLSHATLFLGYFMLFYQVWIARMATRSILTKLQTYPLGKPCGPNSGLKFSFVYVVFYALDIILATLFIYDLK